jgi:hypothetical protein
MDATLGYKIDYIRQKYRTINGKPVEDLPERQIGAIYWSLVGRENKRRLKAAPVETEHQLSIWEVI